MAREFHRSDRLGSQIQREVADLIHTELRDPRLGMVTVSDVEVSRDLSVAKVFVTLLAATDPVRACINHLNQHAQTLRWELGQRLSIRSVPELRFVYDDSIERGMKMDSLLQQLAQDTKSADTE